MKHTLTSIGAATIICALCTSSLALAQTNDVIALVLEPHCSEVDRTSCGVFEATDEMSLTTKTMKVGDILDIDVVLRNGAGKGIETVRGWLSYDPSILEARSVTLSPVVTKPIPGEQTANPTLKIVKIGGGVGEIPSNRASIARVTFRVKSAVDTTTIAFDGYREDGLGQTAVNGVPVMDSATTGLTEPPCFGDTILCQKKVTPMLTIEPASLNVRQDAPHPAAPIENPTDTPAVQTEIAELPANTQTTQTAGDTNRATSFTMLQVQDVRITSKDGTVYLAWKPLRSGELEGYNVYYSTVSGKYVQRKSVPKTANSLVIRDLEAGSEYFFAVKGYSATNQESVYSQEVSVIVGNPDSSSAPLAASALRSEPVRSNPVQSRGGTAVSGETGVGDGIGLFLIISAIIGTAFAAHRQFHLFRSAPRV